MIDLAPYITKDGDTFYFDPDESEQGVPGLQLDYDDGDKVIWKWEGAKMIGTLRRIGYNKQIFVLENPKPLL